MNEKYTRIICSIMLIVALVLTNGTIFVDAHSGDGHEFPTFEKEYTINIAGSDIRVILGCEGFFPIEDENHEWPFILPHKFCFPPGLGIHGPDDEGCYSVTFCGMYYECYGRVCPPVDGDDDDDDDDDDASGNNDDASGNNDDNS
ncbi:hypothetical protein J5I95_22580 [Candidatus Poribacteria bacterium]|nr:hypothetical protein [Candidatus Poribacteria bacterium]